MQIAAINEVAAAGQQELIGHRKADNAEHQQPEDGDIAVGCNPLEDGAFQPAMIAKLVLAAAVEPYPADFRTGVMALPGTTEKNSMKRFLGSGAGAVLASSMHCASEVNWRPSSQLGSTQWPAVMARWTP